LADGVSFLGSNFGVNQRLFNIYDGPATEYNNIYSDVHVTPITTLAKCKPGGNKNPGNCPDSGWMNGYNLGVLQAPPTNNSANTCILPNAAIAWKQPNGFYYPPAFHSDNIFFNNVDIRHYVIQPLYLPNSFNEDNTAIQNTYCTWNPGMFKDSFTDIDRQTELTDDDGSLTGLTSYYTQGTPPAGPTISITKDPFYNSPLVTDECGSDPPGTTTATTDGATVDTSPYEYLTTAIVAPCTLLPKTNPLFCGDDWIQNCSTPACYGVPLYRQSLTTAELTAFTKNKTRPVIRMMGQASAQRSTLTLNHASYYIDTTLSGNAQRNAGQPNVNVFLANRTYYFFFLFAKTTTKQTYSLYIGTGLKDTDAQAALVTGRVGIPDNSFPFSPSSGNWATYGGYNGNTGLLTVNINFSGLTDLMPSSMEPFCQPTSYCSWDKTANTCGCNAAGGCTDPQVCTYGVKDIDCPVAGCYGFSITLPGNFVAATQANLPPTPVTFQATDSYFNKGTVTFTAAGTSLAGNCYYPEVPTQTDLKGESSRDAEE
jgi:hypothetical protein